MINQELDDHLTMSHKRKLGWIRKESSTRKLSMSSLVIRKKPTVLVSKSRG